MSSSIYRPSISRHFLLLLSPSHPASSCPFSITPSPILSPSLSLLSSVHPLTDSTCNFSSALFITNACHRRRGFKRGGGLSAWLHSPPQPLRQGRSAAQRGSAVGFWGDACQSLRGSGGATSKEPLGDGGEHAHTFLHTCSS